MYELIFEVIWMDLRNRRIYVDYGETEDNSKRVTRKVAFKDKTAVCTFDLITVEPRIKLNALLFVPVFK